MNTNLQRPLKERHSNFVIKIVFYTLLIAHYTGYLEFAKCEVLSESIIEDMIKNDEDRGIYRLEHKNEIKQFPKVDYEELTIFCHQGKFSKIFIFLTVLV